MCDLCSVNSWFRCEPSVARQGVSVIYNAATGEGFVDLRVQVRAVGEDEEGEVAAEFAMYFAGEENHGVAFACALCVPEDAEFAFAYFAVADGFNGAVYAEELVVAGEDFLCFTRCFVKEDEVFYDVHEVAFVADTFEEGFHIDDAGVFFG